MENAVRKEEIQVSLSRLKMKIREISSCSTCYNTELKFNEDVKIIFVVNNLYLKI